jgi:hypothetical protein
VTVPVSPDGDLRIVPNLPALRELLDQHRSDTRSAADAGDERARRHLRHLPAWPALALVHLALNHTAVHHHDQAITEATVGELVAALAMPAATVRDVLQLLHDLGVWKRSSTGNGNTPTTRVHRGTARDASPATAPPNGAARDATEHRGLPRDAAPEDRTTAARLDRLVVADQRVVPLIEQLSTELGSEEVDAAVGYLLELGRRSSDTAELERKIRRRIEQTRQQLAAVPEYLDDHDALAGVVPPPAGLDGPAAPFVDLEARRRAQRAEAAS